jgi:alginate O-acetyltransferase complex protein AlgI
MLFNSFIYLIFLTALLPIFYFLPGRKSKNIYLLISSYAFYAYWDWRFCGFIALLTIVNFYIGKHLGSDADSGKSKKGKLLFWSGIVFNLGILIFFKYFNFFIDSFGFFFSIFGTSSDDLHLNLIIPLGISFYTFQNISYVTDVFRKKISPEYSLTDFALYVAFFPKLIAGPIERPGNFLPQLKKKLVASKAQLSEGITLIITGLFKKVMIGDTAGRYVDNIFKNLEYYNSYEIIAALLLFTIQIYADFSGYTSIARGSAKLFGIELMKNFEQPYFSKNISEFWRRWHISLSNWLRDYLYLPLSYSISRNLPKEKYAGLKTEYIIYILSTMVTFTLCGLWHGASWNFVIWGALHGLFLTVHRSMILNRKALTHKAVKSLFKITGPALQGAISIAATFISVSFSLIFFGLLSWNDVTVFFSKVMFWESSENTLIFTSVVIAYGTAVFIFDLFEHKTGSHEFILKIRSKGIVWGILTAMFFVTVIYMFIAEPLPFVYFQF